VIVVDTSAVFAILTKESDSSILRSAIETAVGVRLSSGTYLELTIVCRRRAGDAAVQEMESFLIAEDIRLVPFDAAQADLAAEAYRTYGKGRHRAALNFGDCFAYALAKQLDAPLLYKGTDFSATDIQPAAG
jgi:ribonuclease VapC